MAKTIEQLKAQSAEVKNASVIGENTATRVGSLFNDIVEHVEQETEERNSQDVIIATQLSNEIERAKDMELGISNKLNDEIERATEAENNLQEQITSEADARDLAINAEAQARTQSSPQVLMQRPTELRQRRPCCWKG